MKVSAVCLKLSPASLVVLILTLATKCAAEAERFTRSESRIVDGVNVTPANKYPMVVAFQKDGVYRCSGTILNKNFVLTTGTCIRYTSYGSYPYVVAGIYKLGDPDLQWVQNISVRNVTYHEEFSNPTKGFTANDIAVVQLSAPFVWNKYVLPTNLPAPNWTVLPNEELKVFSVGWGFGRNRTYPFDPIRPLQEAEVIVLTTDLCQRANYYFLFNDDQICTGVMSAFGPCFEDWGGPLFSYNEKGNKYIQIGMTSFMFELCGNSTEQPPPGYTKVSKYVNWVEM